MREEGSGGLGRSGEVGCSQGVDCSALACCRVPCCGAQIHLLFVAAELVLLMYVIEGFYFVFTS